MKKIAAVTAAVLFAASGFGTTAAEARGGGALAAGLIGGLAAGALLGAAAAEAHAAPAYGYADARPVVRYRPARVVRAYDEEVVYRTTRVVRSDETDAEGYGYRAAGYGDRWHCDRPHGYGGW
ncbi:hypothetical protein FV232_05625 [Methylobacterium sp. WL30]|uniref:hypothetical protein n=1 Tax=unclassified Methylobacterium TaxID=2615210 RepID=UPI0011CB30E2|nr:MULTISPECIES: hypothetical protein [unclassified Methylobacterium]TXN39183.1 hypothetical protein FV225_10740 [Methylobacterium sp. WL93]TXN51187.1 hypothetical protein FV227_08620 [Methylobacterium sp. WL119]TXN69395.1 hypothetical protein FV232_05625 [Methylobacterium sp. WL30]